MTATAKNTRQSSTRNKKASRTATQQANKRPATKASSSTSKRKSTAKPLEIAAGKPGKKVNPFHQRLARLTVYQATRLLGENGAKLLAAGSKFEIETERDVYLGGDLYRVRVADGLLPTGLAVVTLTLNSGRNRQLQINCDQCEPYCEHVGGALGHLLEAKTSMGLAAPPDETVALENLTEQELHLRPWPSDSGGLSRNG